MPKTANNQSNLRNINLISIVIYSLVFTLFVPIITYADTLYSPTYNIEMSSIEMGAGTSTSSSYSLNQTMGQNIQGLFGTTGYLIKAGFQYIHPLIPFTFQISSLEIPFGTIVPNIFSTQANTLRVTTGSAHGYTVNVLENHALRQENGSITIPNTSCDLSLVCSITQATPWTDTSRYGFGYNMSGTDVDISNFVNSTYFRPFPVENIDPPVTIMSRTGIATDSAATVTYKINIPGTQAAGTYQNDIQFFAIPSF